MSANDRITFVVLNDDGTRDKFTLGSWVGVPRKHELVWIHEEPYTVVEVEYAVSEGFFGARNIDAAGVYLRKLDAEEKELVAKRLSPVLPAKDQDAFRP